MTKPNMERLEAVLTKIKDHPESHDQGTWGHKTQCGTTACFAGHAALMFDADNVEWSDDVLIPPLKADGRARHDWITYGAELLSISFEEAHVLFHSARSVYQLEILVKGLANGEDITDRGWQLANLFHIGRR